MILSDPMRLRALLSLSRKVNMLFMPDRWLPPLTGLFGALLLAGPIAAQSGTVTGTVVDKSGRQPLNGVQVSVDGTQRGMLTDARGKFSISGIQPGTVVIRATYIGY